MPCPGIVAGSCIKGCVCKENYLRDDSGACIPADQCYGKIVRQNDFTFFLTSTEVTQFVCNILFAVISMFSLKKNSFH